MIPRTPQLPQAHTPGRPRRLEELRRLGMVLLITLVSTTVAGCGGDDDGPPPPAGPEPPTEPVMGDFPVGTLELVVEEGDAPAAFLEGRWTMEIQADGDHFVTHQSGNVQGIASVDGDQFTIRDIAGSLACVAPVDAGTYTWTETDATVTFTVVSDGCDGRRFVMRYDTWNKK